MTVPAGPSDAPPAAEALPAEALLVALALVAAALVVLAALAALVALADVTVALLTDDVARLLADEVAALLAGLAADAAAELLPLVVAVEELPQAASKEPANTPPLKRTAARNTWRREALSENRLANV